MNNRLDSLFHDVPVTAGQFTEKYKTLENLKPVRSMNFKTSGQIRTALEKEDRDRNKPVPIEKI